MPSVADDGFHQKHTVGQARHSVQSQTGNVTPGATPQSQSSQWQPAAAIYHPAAHPQQNAHSSLGGSFMQQFGDTNIDDTFLMDADVGGTTSGYPLQTPPPTRDSTKRKPHQPRLPEFATPPTIRKRPAPRPTTAGIQQSPNTFNYAPEASPFAFSPLTFSPPTTVGFAQSGPVSAPVHTNHVFWDPASFSSFQPTFPTIAEDPFTATTPTAPQAVDFSSSNPVVHRYAASESFAAPPIPPHVRPQTAQPSTGPPMHSLPAGINPNVLRASQVAPGQTETFRAAATGSTPYATQKAALQRERSVRSKKGPGLQRSTTDLMLARSESPLKRQKSNAHPPLASFTTTPRRREVVLTVDERGNASTQVVGEPLPPGQYSFTTEEEGSDTDRDGSVSVSSDAQAAIRQIRHK